VAYRYILFHKPYGVLSQFSPDGSGHPTLKSYIDLPDIYPVGRLDHDSEGLMLLTNHGQLQHRLSDPKFAHERTYWAQVENHPTEAAIQQLQQGIVIQGRLTRPAQAKLILPEPDIPARVPPIRYRQHIPTAWLELCLTEGRNRQVRRMTAAVGFPTLRLVRVKIADLSLANLAAGAWRDLTVEELAYLQQLTQAKPRPALSKMPKSQQKQIGLTNRKPQKH
jgi:23S rRNA pseudouridine2457 synthase